MIGPSRTWFRGSDAGAPWGRDADVKAAPTSGLAGAVLIYFFLSTAVLCEAMASHLPPFFS